MPEGIVYVVQDYNQQLRGVYTTLAKAAVVYRDVLLNGLTEDEEAMLKEEFGEDFHQHIDNPPEVIVYRLDDTWLSSYESELEIKRALEEGENYD